MLIVGAGAAARDLLAMLMLEAEAPVPVFYDDVTEPRPTELFGRYRVLNQIAAAHAYLRDGDRRFLLAVGGPHRRFALARRFRALGGDDVTLISRQAMVGAFNAISPRGVLVMHGSILTNGLTVGEGTLINMRCTLGHNLRIGRWCELAPGATASESEIGDFTFLGIGSLLLPGVSLGRNVTVGAGAVVVRPVPDHAVVAGNPARQVGENPPPPEPGTEPGSEPEPGPGSMEVPGGGL